MIWLEANNSKFTLRCINKLKCWDLIEQRKTYNIYSTKQKCWVWVWQRTRRKFSFVRSTHTHTWWTVRRSPCVPGQEERRINLYHQIWSVGSRCVVHRRLMEYEDIAKQVLAASQLSSCSLRVSCFESPWFNILGWFGCNKYSSHHQEWWTTPWVLNLWLNRKRPFIFFTTCNCFGFPEF